MAFLAFIPGYSGGSATEFHRLPSHPWNKIIDETGAHVKQKTSPSWRPEPEAQISASAKVRSKFTLSERLQKTPESHSRNSIISPGLIEKLPVFDLLPGIEVVVGDRADNEAKEGGGEKAKDQGPCDVLRVFFRAGYPVDRRNYLM